MVCNSCGAEVSDKAVVCPKCGVQLTRKTAAPGNPVHVPNHMVWAILTTLFCCLVGGIIAIVYSSKVNTRLAQGDIAGAQAAAKTAKNWIIANIVVGFILPIVGILMGALMPAVSSAMLNANASTMSIQGRKIVQGIIQANIERSGTLDPVWPRTNVDGVSTDDIASHDSKSATDYFNALFDMKHYGTSEWDPAVDGELLSALSGAGVPGMSGKTLTDQNIAWNIAANVTDETPDFMPVLITANFNPKLLAPGRFNGRDDTPLPIGPTSGAAKSMFGDKAIVIVRKSGAAEVIKKRFLTRSILYNGEAFDDTDRKTQIKWLTPTDVVEPVGYR